MAFSSTFGVLMDSHMGHGTKKTSRLEVNVERYFNANFFYGDRGMRTHRGETTRRCNKEMRWGDGYWWTSGNAYAQVCYGTSG